MRTNPLVTASFLLSIGVPLCAGSARAYERPTHAKLTCLALRDREQALTSSLRRALGPDLTLDSEAAYSASQVRSLRAWMILGSKNEDDGLRVLHHFHNPLAASVDSAGLWALLGRSSIDWMLARSDLQVQDRYYAMSWADARDAYLDALTARTESVRMQRLALTFKALGHMMHLVQDASVPAHSRNDAHLPSGDADYFHYYVDRQARLMFPVGSADFDCENGEGIWDQLGVVRPDPSILSARDDGLLPIANLIDADSFAQADVSLLIDAESVAAPPRLGVAEYSHANFFSEDTLPISIGSSYQYLDQYPEPKLQHDPISQPGNTFFTLTRSGSVIVSPLARQEFVRLPSGELTPLPPSLHDTFDALPSAYARALLPRAIGYSSELPLYFFRNPVRVYPFRGGLSIYYDPGEPISGRFALYYENAQRERKAVPEASWDYELGSSQYSVLTPPFEVPDDATGAFLLVFRGALGHETDTVLGNSFQAQLLSISLPDGHGSIVSDDLSFSCDSSCRFAVGPGSTAQVHAVPNAGWAFSHWSGDCSGNTSGIELRFDANRACAAHFVPAPAIHVTGLSCNGPRLCDYAFGFYACRFEHIDMTVSWNIDPKPLGYSYRIDLIGVDIDFPNRRRIQKGCGFRGDIVDGRVTADCAWDGFNLEPIVRAYAQVLSGDTVISSEIAGVQCTF